MRYALALILFLFVSSTKAQDMIVGGCIVTPISPLENDTLSVKFTPSEFLWGAKISAKKDFAIDWDKSSFIVNGQSSKIAFEDSRLISKDLPRPTEEVPSGSFISKRLYPYDFLEYGSPTISKRFVKKRFGATGNPDTVRIILSMIIDGKNVKQSYLFEIRPK